MRVRKTSVIKANDLLFVEIRGRGKGPYAFLVLESKKHTKMTISNRYGNCLIMLEGLFLDIERKQTDNELNFFYDVRNNSFPMIFRNNKSYLFRNK